MKKLVLGMSFAALLTGFINAPGESNVAHAAEKKLWDSIPKVGKQAELFNTRDYYYNKGDVTETEVTNKRLLYIDKTVQLYNDPDEDPNPIGASLNPQWIEFGKDRENFDGFFVEVKTWLGPKWIKWEFANESGVKAFPGVVLTYPTDGNGEKVFQKISNKNNVPIYKTPGGNAIIDGYIAPQELTVTSIGMGDFHSPHDYPDLGVVDIEQRNGQNGYIGIQTWLGERWVKSSDIDAEELNKEIYPVNIENRFKLYDLPERDHSYKKVGPAIDAQKVFAIQRKGRFIQIKTWLGDKWIEADEYVSDIKPSELFVHGKVPVFKEEKTKHYDRPDYNSNIVNDVYFSSGARLEPSVFYKENGEVWYYTYAGAWSAATDVDTVTKITGKITNKQHMQLYNERFSSTAAKVAPQTIEFKSKLANWYLVDTWIGESWVKVQPWDEVEIVIDEKDLVITDTVKLYKSSVKIDSEIAGNVTPQTVKEIGRRTMGKTKWIQVKVPSTNQEGWILEV